MYHVPEIRDFGFVGSGQLKTAFVFSPGYTSLTLTIQFVVFNRPGLR